MTPIANERKTYEDAARLIHGLSDEDIGWLVKNAHARNVERQAKNQEPLAIVVISTAAVLMASSKQYSSVTALTIAEHMADNEIGLALIGIQDGIRKLQGAHLGGNIDSTSRDSVVEILLFAIKSSAEILHVMGVDVQGTTGWRKK